MNVIEQKIVKTPTGDDYLEASLVELPKRPAPLLRLENVRDGRAVYYDGRACRELAKALAELADAMEREGG